MSKRGHPDYGQHGGYETIAPMSDLGELAARLDSVNTFERSGNVLFQTGFEAGLAEMLIQTNGVGSSVSVDTTRSYKGAQSIKLTAGNGVNYLGGVVKRIRPIAMTKIGMECTFSIAPGLDEILIQLQLNNGTSRYRYKFIFDAADNDIKLLDDTGTLITLVSYDFGGGDPDLWHTAKVVGNMSDKKYVRLVINDDEYNLSTYNTETVVDATVKRLEAYIAAVNRTATGADGYIDNMILTINEP